MSRKLNLTVASIGLVAALLLVSISADARQIERVRYVASPSTNTCATNSTGATFQISATDAEMIVVFVETRTSSAVNETATVTFAGQAMTPVPNGSIENTTGNVRAQLFYYINSPISGYTGNQNVVVTLANQVNYAKYGAMAFRYIEKTNPLQDSDSLSGQVNSSTSLGVALDTAIDGTTIFMAGVVSIDGNINPIGVWDPDVPNPEWYQGNPDWDPEVSGQIRAEGWWALIPPANNLQYTGYVRDGGSGTGTLREGVVMGASMRPDLTGPAVALASSAPDPVSGAITVNVTLGEESNNFVVGDISRTNATVSGFTRNSPSWTSYTFTLTPSGQGTFSAQVNAAACTDYAGNNNTASNVLSRTNDSIAPLLAPTGAIVRVDPSPTNAAQVNWTVTFTESVTGVDAADFTLNPTVTGASIGTVTGSGTTWNVLANTGSGSGSLQLNMVDNDTIRDAANNPLGGAGTGTVYNGEAYTIDKDPPTGTSIIINGGAPYTNSSTVTLTLAATGATQMSFSNGGGVWSSWATYNTTSSWDLAGTDGTKTVQAKFRDAVGNESAPVSDSIILDTTPPTATSIVINGGDAYTTSSTVTLTLAATDATQMSFSNGGGVWSSWATYDTTSSWDLAGTDGTKTVQAKFRDAAGNESAPVSDSIILDTTPPTATSIMINGGATYTNSSTVTLKLAATGATEMSFNNGLGWSSWATYDTTYSWGLAGTDGTKTVQAKFRDAVYVRFWDAAGNSYVTYDTIILDTSGPNPAYCSVVINGSAATTTDPNVTLTLEAIDDYGTVVSMSFSNDNAIWSTPVPYATTSPWTLAGPDGLNFVYAKFIDDLGNETVVADDITLDTAHPTASSIVINDGDEFTNSLSLSVLVTTAEIDVQDIQYSTDGSTWSGWHIYEPLADLVNVNTPDGIKTVYAQLRDTAGNVSLEEISDTIILDQTPPTGSVIIAGDVDALNYNPVELTVSATDPGALPSGVASMLFSNDGSAWSPPEAYATTRTWWLATGEGTRTVYVKFIDNAGNESTGLDSDTVEVDTTPPSPPNVTGPTPTNDTTPTWSWTSVDGEGPGTVWRWSLNDGPWSDPTTDKSYTPELPLEPDGEYTLCVQEGDGAGNWSDPECFTIIIDTIGPNAPVVTGLHETRNLQPTWSWLSGGGGGNGQYRFQLNGTDDEDWVPTSALSYTPDVPLPDKQTHTLYVQERDAAGNWSLSGTWAIIVDSDLVTAPSVSGVTPTNDTTPLWTWLTGGGLAHYRYQLDGENEADWTETDATSWAPEPADALGEGVYTLYVQELRIGDVWSASGSFAITVDLTLPAAPIVSSSGTPRTGLPDITDNLQPVWSWTTGGGGNLTFRYQLDATDVAGWTETTDIAFSPAGPLSEGVHTMYVQERDEAGNWSESGERAVEIDTTAPNPPVVTGPGITSDTTPMWIWVGGGGGNGTFRYQLDGQNEGFWTVTTTLSFVPDDPLSDGVHTLYVQERDDAGLWSASGSGVADVQPGAPGAPVVTSPEFSNVPQVTWNWTSGGGSGNFRYQLDSAAEWTPTTETSFTADSLGEGFHTLYVQEASVASVWSASGSSTTLVDFTSPNAPVVTGPGTTADATPTWTWTPGGGGNGTFRYQLDSETGEWTETTETEFTPGQVLAAGPHILYVEERDDAGNWSLPGSWSVSVQLAGPQPPVVSGPEATNNLRPRWTWVGGGGGNGRFRYQLNSEAGTWQLTTAISFRPLTPFTDGEYTLFVQEQDALGNWSQSGQWTIVIDTVPPAPPLLTGATPVRTKQPTWTWTPGGGGNGLFRVQIDSEEDAWTVTTELSYSPPLELEKNAHTLYAQEADAAGNWSASSFYTIVIDDNAVLSPIVSGATPTNDTTPTWSWEAAPDSGGNGQFSYRLDGGAWVVAGGLTSFTPAAPLAQGAHVLDVRESDQFNEWSWPGSFTININLGLPVITIVGDNPAQVSAGTAYTDEGATAVDADENDITDDIVVTGLPIDTNVIGSYSVTYSLTGYAVEAVRTVNVVSGVTEVTIASPVADSTLYMPATGTVVLLALTSVAPEGTETVTYTFDDVEVGSATEAPWLVVVELTPAAALFGEHTIGAAEASKASSDEVMLTIAEIPAGADTDANGIPDSPFTTLGSGDIWAQDGVIVLRTDGVMPVPAGAPNMVALANPANPAQSLLAALSPSVLGADEMAVIILKAADDLVELLGAEEAALVADTPTGYVVVGDLYGSLNVAVSDGSSYWNLEGEALENYPVTVTVQDSLADDVAILLHAAEVMDGTAGVVIGIPDAAIWDDTDIVHLDVAGGTATATLSALGLVAAFETEAAEGEGEGEPGPQCFAANLQPPTTPGAGDGMILLLAIALLLPALRLRPRARAIR